MSGKNRQKVKIKNYVWGRSWKTALLYNFENFISYIVEDGGGSQVVSMLDFYSNDPSLNPAEVYIFLSNFCWKDRK